MKSNAIQKKSIVTFGEIMLRLGTRGNERFAQAGSFEASFGGAEANVAVSLARFGHEARYVSRIPASDLGDAAVAALRKEGVGTEFILREGERLGIYFLERGAAQRASKVIYDRAHSAAAEIAPGMVAWEQVFAGASWFHITGITPALSVSAADAAIEAVQAAREAGLPVSFDLNYRSKLWPRARAEKVLGEIAQECTLLISNEEDAQAVFGIRAAGVDAEAGEVEAQHYLSIAGQLREMFPNAERVAITLRESLSASDNNWSGVLLDGKEFYRSPKYAIRVVDRIGTGDAFAAGLIHGLLERMEPQRALDFAVAASCLKHSIPGDWNLCSLEEVEALMMGKGKGRVER